MITLMKRTALLSLALNTALIGGFAHALEVEQITGKAEVFQGTWQTPQLAVPLAGPLRTGAGRVSLKMGEGKVLVAGQTLLEVKNNEPALKTGQIYLEGPLLSFVGKHHLKLEAGGSARVDFVTGTQRVVLLSGKGNVYNADTKKSVPLEVNKSLNILTFVQTDFLERDPWYKERLTGLGLTKLAAFKGTVELQNGATWQTMSKNQPLETEGQVRTGKESWAEFDFEDGSYFRLGAEAILKVLGIEKLEGGKRRFVMSLEKGSAWNVVAKGKGGYEMRTSTLVAGVRGTVFRFDESGLVKVIEGQVATVTEAGEQPIDQGQQLQKGRTVPLKLDTADKTNLRRDAQKSAALQVELNWPETGIYKDLEVYVSASVGAEVTASFGGDSTVYPLIPNKDKGYLRLHPQLSEGNLEVKISVTKGEQKQDFVRQYQIDQSKPILRDLKVTVLNGQPQLTATLEDQSPVTFKWRYLNRSEYVTLELKAGAISVPLEGVVRAGKVVVQLKDAANNFSTYFVEVSP
jgi:FecR protein